LLKYAFATALVLVVILVGALIRKQKSSEPTHQEPQSVMKELAPVTSSIRNLEVVSTHINDRGLAIVTVLNNTGNRIQALAVSSGNYMVIDDDGLISDLPKPIIEPQATYTIEIPVANLKEKVPIVISGVIYDDDSEAGIVDIVKKIRDARLAGKREASFETECCLFAHVRTRAFE
jgi:hypothetical protein